MTPALLLLGPTGAGKSPLGNFFALHGIGNRHCLHFDFGLALREFADGDRDGAGLGEGDRKVVRKILAARALLEDAQFYLARGLVQSAVREASRSRAGLVLNGLPRHVGQARDLGDDVDICLVACLDCPAETVMARIADNSGGDRAARDDDALRDIQTKLIWYQERTLPLVSHYRDQGVTVMTLAVGVETQPADLSRPIAEQWNSALACRNSRGTAG